MIIKMFNQGKGKAGPIIGYLFNEEKHKGFKPELVSGNPELTKRIIDSTNRKNKYTTGVISFKEGENLTELQQLEVIHKFERTMAPFAEEDRINFLWVRHMDKGRLELHFLVPMSDLKTGLQYNISPPGKPNQNFYKGFQDILNYKFGFNSVVDPTRKLKENEYRQLCKEVEGYYNKRKEYISKRYDSPKITKIKGKKYGNKQSISKFKYSNHSFKQHYYKSIKQNSFGRANKLQYHGNTKSGATRVNSFNEKVGTNEQQINAIREIFSSSNGFRFGGRGKLGGERVRHEQNEESNKAKHDIKTEILGMSLEDKILYLSKKLSYCSNEEIGQIYEQLGALQAQKLAQSVPKMKF